MSFSDKRLQRVKNLKQLPMVEVSWKDANARGGWKTLDEARAVGAIGISSVGYLTRCDKDVVQVQQSIGENGTMADSITIPRGWVLKMRRVR